MGKVGRRGPHSERVKKREQRADEREKERALRAAKRQQRIDEWNALSVPEKTQTIAQRRAEANAAKRKLTSILAIAGGAYRHNPFK